MRWQPERSNGAAERSSNVGSVNFAEFDSMCKSAALLVEAERLAKLGSWEHDLPTNEEIWSPNLSEMLGFDRAVRRVPDSVFWDLVHPDDHEMVRTIVKCALMDRLPTYEYQCRFALPNNRERVFFTKGKLDFDSADRLVRRMGVTQDITVAVEMNRVLVESDRLLRISESELRSLSGRLLQLQDYEKRSVSLALHERTSQSIVGMRMRIGALVGDGSLTPSVREALIDCEKIASDAIEELGSLSQILHPPLLEEGLGLAIRGYVCRFARTSGIHVSIEISKDLERLPAPYERALFRIVQECLTNVDRHSGSRWARISLERQRGAVALVVEDGGKGLSDPQVRDPDAEHWNFGIPVMRERIRQLHGTFHVESSSGGVTVRTTLPISQTAR